MIADGASFASTESQTFSELSTTLQEVLNINNDTTDDNSAASSPEEYDIRPPGQDLILDSGANISVYHHLSISSLTTSQLNIPVPAPLPVTGPPVICPERAISQE